MTTKNILIILSFLIVIGLFSFGWYQNQEQETEEEPVVANNELPAGWSWQESQACDLRVSLPPREEPYLSDIGEYWRYEENAQVNHFFNHNIIALFHNPELGGSGYVPGAVLVSCAPNLAGDTAESLANRYSAYLALQSQDAPPETQITLHPRETITLWEQEVLVANYEGGMFDPTENYYFLATDRHLYLIYKPQHSGDEFIRQTTEEIFAGLDFNL